MQVDQRSADSTAAPSPLTLESRPSLETAIGRSDDEGEGEGSAGGGGGGGGGGGVSSSPSDPAALGETAPSCSGCRLSGCRSIVSTPSESGAA